MTFLVFDTETTGLPKRYNLNVARNLSNWDFCRLVQIAWMIFDDDNQLLISECKLVIPDGFTISQESMRIHGISTEQATEHGEPSKDVINEFMNGVNNVDIIVAHNMSFDADVITSELLRCDMDTSEWLSKKKYCTMKTNTGAGCKYPKLCDLYKRLIGPIDDKKLHTADVDCEMCAEIYIACNTVVKNDA